MALQRPHAPWHAARANHVLARIASAQGRWADADRHAHACLDLLVAHGIWIDVALALDALAEAAAGLESHDEAARLLGAAARAREDRGLVRWAADEEHFTALAARLGEELGERELAEACAEGRELSTTEAIAWARRARGSRARPSAGWESLTPTELQIADLVAEGLTNVQIGERMFISRGTAKVHVSNVLRKLGMTTRSEIAAEATRRSTQAHADA
jgi:DNA-binding CsgD family transcriptional regulator